ncbi:MAG: flavin reductase family protein [Spirochaetia bacterium]|jgi:flavin reductase (DIM6/NTAB) family NADH-FMN oxidoreductase RutF|nr:flavin reductase family protein [Spirochaetia bacterium]
MQKESGNTSAVKRKYPEPVILIIVKDRKGKYNLTPCSWTMTASRDPLLFAFSLSQKRYSLEAIRRKGEFVISFPSSLMADEVLFYGTTTGRDTDKLSLKPLKTRKAETVDSLILEESAANFECILESEYIAGDHIIVTARVLKAWQNEDESIKRLFNLAPGYKLSGVAEEKTQEII